jgi:flagellar biosynthesis protein FlhA
LGVNVLAQVGGHPRATLIAAGMLLAMALLPGLPKVPFLVLATMLLIGWRTTRDAKSPADLLGNAAGAAALSAEGKAAANPEPSATEKEAVEVEELLRIDRISLEIGYRLIPLVQAPGGSGILDHIAQLRRRFAGREGLVIPPVRIKDNIRLAPGAYRVLLGGQEVARGEVEVGHCMAMDPGGATGKLKGKPTFDPAFGLPAWWIHESARDEAEILGFTVVDPTSVLVTHLTEVLRNSLGEILSRDDVKELVESAKKVAPAVVEELVPARIGYGEVQAVLKNLLRDGVSIRNLPAILEAIADNCAKIKDADQLSELVRQRLSRSLVEQHADKGGTVHAVTLDPAIEVRLAAAFGAQPDPRAEPVSPAFLSRLVGRIGDQIAHSTQGGKDVVLVVRSNVRRFLGELVRASLPKVSVLSYNEVVPARAVETLSIVRMEGEAGESTVCAAEVWAKRWNARAPNTAKPPWSCRRSPRTTAMCGCRSASANRRKPAPKLAQVPRRSKCRSSRSAATATCCAAWSAPKLRRPCASVCSTRSNTARPAALSPSMRRRRNSRVACASPIRRAPTAACARWPSSARPESARPPRWPNWRCVWCAPGAAWPW